MLMPLIAVLTRFITRFANLAPQMTDLATAKLEKIQEFELPRRPSDFRDELNLLWSQVWYNRHQETRIAIEEGYHSVVSRKPKSSDETMDTVWTQALDAARQMDDDIGLDRLGPWTDFEWGLINGKMSALEWMLGDEWDIDVTAEGADARKWRAPLRQSRRSPWLPPRP